MFYEQCVKCSMILNQIPSHCVVAPHIRAVTPHAMMADGAIEADRHYLESPQLSKDGSKLAALEGDSWKIMY